MTKKEIVLVALDHKEPEIVPYHLVFLPPVQKRILEYFGNNDIDRAVGNFVDWKFPPVDFGRKWVSHDEWVDEWGVKWKGAGVNRGYVTHHPLTEPDLSLIKEPNPHIFERWERMNEACARHKDLFLIGWCGELFERAHFLRGMNNLFIDIYDRPDSVHSLLDVCLRFCLGMVEELARFPIDAIMLSDDYGYQNGPLFSRNIFKEFFLPRLKHLFSAIHKTGKKVGIHSCGDITAFIPDLIEIGLDILNPLQPEALDIFAIKKKFGNDVSLYGGISTQELLPYGSPEKIKQCVGEVKAKLSKNGGFILAPGLDIQHDVPTENILAFLEAAKKN